MDANTYIQCSCIMEHTTCVGNSSTDTFNRTYVNIIVSMVGRYTEMKWTWKDDLKFLFKSESKSACKCEDRTKIAMANIQKESN